MREGTASIDLARALLAGERLTLARAITATEDDSPDALRVARAVYGHTGRAQTIGVTGAPGVGKSTLVSALTRATREQGRTVAIVAVDPSSPFSGGAILGDRVRMSEHAADEGVFIRSLASRGHLGGVSEATVRTLDVLDAAGFDLIIIETVGTGQSEVEIAGIAQTVLVVATPGLGDNIQALKAGILEIADIVVLNKADMPASAQAENHLLSALSLVQGRSWTTRVMQTVASTGKGVRELLTVIGEHFAQLRPALRDQSARQRIRKLLAITAARQIGRGIESLNDVKMETICDCVLRGQLDVASAATRAARIVSGRSVSRRKTGRQPTK